jgi:DNA mismatch repair protein MLH3
VPCKDNSAYLVNERPITSVSQRLPNLLSLSFEHVASTTRAEPSGNCVDGSFSSSFDQTSIWRLQKDDLARMKVINQVDRKFIVCAVDPVKKSDDGGEAAVSPLVLVDQHAASERVRVEGFLKNLCHHFLKPESSGNPNVSRVELDPPLRILLSQREASILRGTRGILGRWCIDLSWPERENRDQHVDQEAHEQLLVHSVPHVVSDKVR